MQIFNPFANQKFPLRKEWTINLPKPHNYRTQFFLPIVKRYLQENHYKITEDNSPALAFKHGDDISVSPEQEEKFHKENFAILIICANYKEKIIVTDKKLELTQSIRQSLISTKEKIEKITKTPFSTLKTRKVYKKNLEFLKRFEEHMNNDFDTRKAFEVLFGLDIYMQTLYEKGKLGTTCSVNPNEYVESAVLFKYFLDILGLKLEKNQKELTTHLENIILSTIEVLKNEEKDCPNNYYRQKFCNLIEILKAKLKNAKCN